MHTEPKVLLKQVIQKCLPILQPLAGKYSAPHHVWKKTGEGQWHGEVVQRPDMMQVFRGTDKETREAGEPFAESFFAHHPEYSGMVGIPGSAVNLGSDRGYIFHSALGHLWRRHGTFELGETAVDDLVNEFEAFVDKPAIRLLFRSQLHNLTMPGDSINLPQGLRIRRMSDDEVSSFHGAMGTLGMWPGAPRLHEFCIEGETEEPKVFGNPIGVEQPAIVRVKALLDKAILCLRTFKEGHVGYDSVHFIPVTFCPLPLLSYGSGEPYVPFGIYTLKAEEIDPLTEHSKLIFGGSEPSMEMACSRLADAETRTRPHDRLVDAVIGMETLLLANLGRKDRTGELKFRFSLHYSTLFNTPEDRHRAFRLAKDLYDLRSMVAHGSSLGDKAFSIGDKKLKLPEAAKQASETLRHLVRHFLPSLKQAPYKKPEFWERAYFGLPEAPPNIGRS
jgi:hypothetical protein